MIAFLLFFFQELSVRGPEPEVVPLGSRSVIVLSVERSGKTSAQLGAIPDVNGLKIVAGRPSQSSFQSIVNGRISSQSSISWQISIEPLREGKFEIPPFTVEIDCKPVLSKPLTLEAVKDVSGEKYGFLEVDLPRERYYVHEPVRVKLRFGFDERFLKSNMIQLFNQRLDIPTQLRASWVTGMPGTISLEEESKPNDELVGFALNDRLAGAKPLANQTRDGRSFKVVEIEKSFLPTASGELDLPAPMLRFAYASRFEEDFFNGRVAVDRQDGFIYGKPRKLQILPLPEEGRPAEYTGAVGRFTVLAEASPRELKVGESLKFTLRIEGEGNLEFFDPPRLAEIKGFHVYGKIEEKSANRRSFIYDLAPLSEEVKELPAVSFAYFDTNSPAGYRRVQTAPIPLQVRPLPPGATLQPLPGEDAKRAVPGESDIFDMKPASGAKEPGFFSISTGGLMAILLAPWGLALGFWSWLRARERERADPLGMRARAAAAQFQSRMTERPNETAEALTQYLAARLKLSEAAVIGPDLKQRLESAGVTSALASRASSTFDALLASRYSGQQGAANNQAELRQLVEQLEQAFRSQEGRA